MYEDVLKWTYCTSRQQDNLRLIERLTGAHTWRDISYTWSASITQELDKYVRLQNWRISTLVTYRSHVHRPCELHRHMRHNSPEAAHYKEGKLAGSSDFALLGSRVPPKCEIPCPGRRWTTVQNLTPLALSSAKKSVNVQTHTQKTTKKRTVTDISTPCLSACVDSEFIGCDATWLLYQLRVLYNLVSFTARSCRGEIQRRDDRQQWNGYRDGLWPSPS